MGHTFESKRDITNRELTGEVNHREAQELRYPSGAKFLMTRAAIAGAGLQPVTVGEFSKLQEVYTAQSSNDMSHAEIVDSWTIKEDK